MQLDLDEQKTLASKLGVSVDQFNEIRAPGLQLVRPDGSDPPSGWDFRNEVYARYGISPGQEWFGKALFGEKVISQREALWLDDFHAWTVRERSLRDSKEAAVRTLTALVPDFAPATVVVEKVERYPQELPPGQSYPYPEPQGGWFITLSYRPQEKTNTEEPSMMTMTANLARALGGGPRYRITARIEDTGRLLSYEAA